MNSTSPHESKLEAFSKLFVSIVLVIIITGLNGAFVYTFFKSQVFTRDPRYVLYIHLVINDMILLKITVLLQILTYTVRMSFAPCCFLLFFLLIAVKNSPLNLAGMAVERCIAVCRPLHHVHICTVQRAYALIALIWVISIIPPLTDIIIAVTREPLSVFSGTLICHPAYLFTTPYHRTQRLVVQVLLFSFVCLLVIITYLKVFFAARAASASDQASARNARNTILLHGVQLLVCMISFVSPFINLLFVTTWPLQSHRTTFISFVLITVLPRLLSSLIYGMRDKKFSSHIRLHFCCKHNKSAEKTVDVMVGPRRKSKQVLHRRRL